MSGPAERPAPGSTEDWLNHAASDLRLARLALPDHQVLRNQVAFHAQQAAEKAIKAVLAHRGVHFPRTHDLEALLEIVHLTGITWPFATAEVEALTPFAVETRYPGCVAQVTDPEARQAIEAAEQVLRWARSLAH